jgi:hypothetical protein
MCHSLSRVKLSIVCLYIFLDLQISLRGQVDIFIANWQLVYISLMVFLLAQLHPKSLT